MGLYLCLAEIRSMCPKPRIQRSNKRGKNANNKSVNQKAAKKEPQKE